VTGSIWDFSRCTPAFEFGCAGEAGRERGVGGSLTVGPTNRKKDKKNDKIESYDSIL
jgi:hypothetical protein